MTGKAKKVETDGARDAWRGLDAQDRPDDGRLYGGSHNKVGDSSWRRPLSIRPINPSAQAGPGALRFATLDQLWLLLLLLLLLLLPDISDFCWWSPTGQRNSRRLGKHVASRTIHYFKPLLSTFEFRQFKEPPPPLPPNPPPHHPHPTHLRLDGRNWIRSLSRSWNATAAASSFFRLWNCWLIASARKRPDLQKKKISMLDELGLKFYRSVIRIDNGTKCS